MVPRFLMWTFPPPRGSLLNNRSRSAFPSLVPQFWYPHETIVFSRSQPVFHFFESTHSRSRMFGVPGVDKPVPSPISLKPPSLFFVPTAHFTCCFPFLVAFFFLIFQGIYFGFPVIPPDGLFFHRIFRLAMIVVHNPSKIQIVP